MAISIVYDDREVLHKNRVWLYPNNLTGVEGNNPDVGLYFVPVENPSEAVKVTRIAENTASKIIGIAPQTEYQQNRIVVKTQYSGSGSTLLKEPRTIQSAFIIEEA
jgi:hypothetical protein